MTIPPLFLGPEKTRNIFQNYLIENLQQYNWQNLSKSNNSDDVVAVEEVTTPIRIGIKNFWEKD